MTCSKHRFCVRREGHWGCCTAAPGAATLDWDQQNRSAIAAIERQVRDAVDLVLLDFPTPHWADLND